MASLSVIEGPRKRRTHMPLNGRGVRVGDWRTFTQPGTVIGCAAGDCFTRALASRVIREPQAHLTGIAGRPPR